MANEELKDKNLERLVVGTSNPEQGENDTGDLEIRTDELDTEKLQVRRDALIGTTLDDKLEIVSLLGKGGMSSVYKARHIILDRVVAVKVMHPHFAYDAQAVQRFQREAKAAFAFHHENLVSVHDIGTTPDGLPYFVMDYVEGRSLADIIDDGGPLELPRAMEIFRQVCTGLKAAHNKGVVHRDIKPANILLCTIPDGTEQVKIADFGIAKVLTEDGNQIQKLTQTGEIFGSPLYMSPEQCLGNAADRRSDIYSFGCVMYECLRGEAPLVGATPFDTLSKHVGELPERLPGTSIPESVSNAILCCLEKRPEDRYQTVEELENDLFGQQISRRAKRRSQDQARRPLTWLKRVVVTIVILLALGSVSFVAIFWNVLQSTFFPRPWQAIAAQANAQRAIGPSNYDAARSLFLKAVATAEKENAPLNDKEILYTELARLCYQSNDWKSSIRYFTKALELNKTHPQNFETASINDWLGEAYMFNNQYKEAVSHGETAVEIKKRTLGSHPFTLYALLHLGQEYRCDGRLIDSEAANREALTMALALYPDGDDVNLADAYQQLGNVLGDLGKYEESVDNHKKALAVSTKSRGPEHKLTNEIRDLTVDYMKKNGHAAEAEKLLKEFND